jgi:hypothetical protein
MIHVTKRMLAALLVIAALAAPAASARPIDRVLPPGTTHETVNEGAPSQVGSVPVSVQPVDTSSDGFDWGDAGIGAAAMLTLLGLGTGALLVGRRSREQRSAATS